MRRRYIFIALALAIGCIAGVAVLELGLRAYLGYRFRGSLDSLPADSITRREHWLGTIIRPVDNDDLVYVMRPGIEGEMSGAPIRINKLGFHDDPIEREKPDGVYRILMLGDSNTFGWGVAMERNYSEVLEDSLNAALRSEGPARRVEVVNLGTPGYNAVQEVELFHRIGLEFGPDAVMLLYDQNDTLVPGLLVDPPQYRLDRLYVAHLREYFSGGFFNAQNLMSVFADLGRPGPDGGAFVMDETLIPKRYAHLYGWTALAAAYGRLATTCEQRGLPLRIILPTHDLYEDYDLKSSKHYDSMRGLAAELRVPIIDMFAPHRALAKELGLRTPDLSVDFPVDVHPNAIRHAMMARVLLPESAAIMGEERVDAARLEEGQRDLGALIRTRAEEWRETHPKN